MDARLFFNENAGLWYANTAFYNCDVDYERLRITNKDPFLALQEYAEYFSDWLEDETP